MSPNWSSYDVLRGRFLDHFGVMALSTGASTFNSGRHVEDARLITVAQLTALGVTRAHMRTQLRRGDWRVVIPRVISTLPPALTDHETQCERARAALLRLRPAPPSAEQPLRDCAAGKDPDSSQTTASCTRSCHAIARLLHVDVTEVVDGWVSRGPGRDHLRDIARQTGGLAAFLGWAT
jgi:hypothetical protein